MLLHHKHPHVRFVATHRLTFVPDPRHVTACAQEMKSNADIMAEAKASGKTYQVSQRASAPPKARNSARACARECCRAPGRCRRRWCACQGRSPFVDHLSPRTGPGG